MDLAFDLQDFLDQVTNDLIMNAPAVIQEMVMSSDTLQAQLYTYQGEIRTGLQSILDGSGTVEDLEKILRARKTQVILDAPNHSFTVERLMAGVNDRVFAQAKALTKS